MPTRIFVNDRLDVTLAERASGVHLGEKGLPLAEVSRIVESRGERKDFLIGVSCHSLEAARAAANGGADYLFFGRAVAIPVLAIGGIALANTSECLAAGAAGIAAIRLFQDVRDMPSLVQSLRELKS